MNDEETRPQVSEAIIWCEFYQKQYICWRTTMEVASTYTFRRSTGVWVISWGSTHYASRPGGSRWLQPSGQPRKWAKLAQGCFQIRMKPNKWRRIRDNPVPAPVANSWM